MTILGVVVVVVLGGELSHHNGRVREMHPWFRYIDQRRIFVLEELSEIIGVTTEATDIPGEILKCKCCIRHIV